MTDRATLETDAAIYCASPNESVVHFGFARKLENERDAALAKLAKCREALGQIANAVVMKSHDAGECIAAEHRDQARETFDATK
jgi:hypothetical protein